MKIDGTKLPSFGDPDMDFLKHWSPEERKMIWDLCKPIMTNYKGVALFYGTGGELMTNKFEDMFYDTRTD